MAQASKLHEVLSQVMKENETLTLKAALASTLEVGGAWCMGTQWKASAGPPFLALACRDMSMLPDLMAECRSGVTAIGPQPCARAVCM